MCTDPLFTFRQRHPALRLYVSFDDYLLENTTSQEIMQLISCLKKTDASDMDVNVNSRTSSDSLLFTLRKYQQFLNANAIGLSITIKSRRLQLGIGNLVDTIFVIPDTTLKEGIEGSNFHFRNELLAAKLVIGLPSVSFSTNAVQDPKKIPSFDDFCHGSTHSAQWQPRIKVNGQLVWIHSQMKWEFAVQTRETIDHRLTSFFRNSSPAGILLFDVSFHLDNNPICAMHKNLFLNSIRQALEKLGHKIGYNKMRVKRALSTTFTSIANSQVNLSTDRNSLSKILIFAVGKEDDAFRKYYSIHDEKSLLDSPVLRITLGFDDDGRIYDIHKKMPRDLSYETILKTIHQFYIDKVITGGGGSAFGSAQLQPPSILVYPEVLGNVYPLPILITWLRVVKPEARFVPHRPRKPSTTTSTTTIPNTYRRLCTNGTNPIQRCYVPVELLEVLNLKSLPSVKVTPTRKPMLVRQTTTLSASSINPLARENNSNDRTTS